MKRLVVKLKKRDIRNINYVLTEIAKRIEEGYHAGLEFPVDWFFKKKDPFRKKYVYILFETDIYKTISSRIFLGVFKTQTEAIDTAKANNCYRNDCEVEIIQCEINQFKEL